MEKSITEKIDLCIAKIAYLSNQINRKTEMCAMFSDVGHCNYISLIVHSSKKQIWLDKTPIKFEISYKNDNESYWNKDDENRLNELLRCVDFLDKTLSEKNIKYDLLDEIKEYVITGYYI